VRKLVRVDAGDEIAIAFYRNDTGTPGYAATAIHVITFDGALVGEIHAFLDASLFARFGLPAIHR
jgi:hypothetical protein